MSRRKKKVMKVGTVTPIQLCQALDVNYLLSHWPINTKLQRHKRMIATLARIDVLQIMPISLLSIICDYCKLNHDCSWLWFQKDVTTGRATLTIHEKIANLIHRLEQHDDVLATSTDIFRSVYSYEILRPKSPRTIWSIIATDYMRCNYPQYSARDYVSLCNDSWYICGRYLGGQSSIIMEFASDETAKHRLLQAQYEPTFRLYATPKLAYVAEQWKIHLQSGNSSIWNTIYDVWDRLSVLQRSEWQTKMELHNVSEYTRASNWLKMILFAKNEAAEWRLSWSRCNRVQTAGMC